MSRAVLLFARSPRREAAAKNLPDGAPLFRKVIAAWLRAVRDCGAVPLVACAAIDREELARIEPAIERVWIEQSGATFGDRAANATAAAFDLGHTAVVLAAIDAPPPALAGLFEHLERGTTVIAPSRDGGINCIGLTAPEPELIARFTPRRRDLVALCRRWLANVVVLDAVIDVDSASALDAARRDLAWRGYLSPHVPLTSDAPVVRSRRARCTALRGPPPSG